MKIIEMDLEDEAFALIPKAIEVLDRILKSADVQQHLGEIEDVIRYRSKRRGLYVGRHKVSRRPGSQDRAQLRLGSRWLEQAGFQPYARFQVITLQGLLLMVPVHDVPDFETCSSAA